MSRPRFWRALGVVACVVALGVSLQVARVLPIGYDFAAYWSAARDLAAGVAIYPTATEPLGQSGQFKYLPIVAAPFLLLAPLSLDVATIVWVVVELAIAAALGVVLLGAIPGSARPWAAAAYVLFLPLVLEIALGNVNLLSVALAVLAWHFREDPRRAALPLATSVGIKFLTAAMLFFYVAAGRWRHVAYAAVVGLSALALSAPWLWPHLRDYVALSPRLGDTTWIREVIAREEPRFLADILWSDPFLRGLSIATIAAVVILGRASRDSRDPTLLHHTALAVSPYLAPFAFVWTTFLVATLPLFAVCVARTLGLQGTARALRLAVLAISWLLMQAVQVHDLVPVLAHLVGLVGAVGVALSLTPGRSSPFSRATPIASM